jgi:hypothetical protein
MFCIGLYYQLKSVVIWTLGNDQPKICEFYFMQLQTFLFVHNLESKTHFLSTLVEN